MQENTNVKKGNNNMNMPKLMVMVGIPGSGKSTFAKHYSEDANNMPTVWISRDEVRYSLISDKDEYFAKEKDVFKVFAKKINEALAEGKNVIADATHINAQSRKKLLASVTIPNIQIEACVMETSLQECLKNNEKRSGRACVPKEAILRMYRQFEYPTFAEGFSSISNIK